MTAALAHATAAATTHTTAPPTTHPHTPEVPGVDVGWHRANPRSLAELA